MNLYSYDDTDSYNLNYVTDTVLRLYSKLY